MKRYNLILTALVFLLFGATGLSQTIQLGDRVVTEAGDFGTAVGVREAIKPGFHNIPEHTVSEVLIQTDTLPVGVFVTWPLSKVILMSRLGFEKGKDCVKISYCVGKKVFNTSYYGEIIATHPDGSHVFVKWDSPQKITNMWPVHHLYLVAE